MRVAYKMCKIKRKFTFFGKYQISGGGDGFGIMEIKVCSNPYTLSKVIESSNMRSRYTLANKCVFNENSKQVLKL